MVVWCDGRQPEAYQWFLSRQIRGIIGARSLHQIIALSGAIRTWLYPGVAPTFNCNQHGLHLAEERQQAASGAIIADLSAGAGDGQDVCSPGPATVCGHYYVVRRNLALIKHYAINVLAMRSGYWNRVISRLCIDSFRKVEHWFGDYARRFQNKKAVCYCVRANDSRP